MSHLSLSLMGPFQAELDGRPATGIESNKVRALLVFLAVEADKPHARQSLAGLLWPDYTNRSALNNLRSALANLRQAIGDQQSQPPFLIINRDTIQFNSNSDHWLDLKCLQDLPGLTIEKLEQAVSACRGSFLEGFSLTDSPPFEEWLLYKREQTNRQTLGALQRLAVHYEGLGDYARTITYTRQRLELEPWDEDAHRQMMRVLACSGQRSAALMQYETCRQLLKDELGVEPGRATTTLYENIRDESYPPASARLPGGMADLQEEPPAPGEPPYKGLHYFEEDDADLFFGREALTARLVTRVNECLSGTSEQARFLAIIGASGSGKSSILRAGLISALRHKQSPGGQDFALPFDGALYLITPTARPLEALAITLTRKDEPLEATTRLLDELARDPRSLHLAACRTVQNHNASHLLLLVDQFEELFSLCHDEAERQAFIDNLLYATTSPGPIMVVASLRADFYAHCAPYENLRLVLSQSQEYIGAMNTAELRRAIEEPARRGGWELEPGLVDLLLREVGNEPGALPLLSHALLETWQRRRGRRLTLAGYAEAGGVHGAIARTAETTFNQLTSEQQDIARNIFLRLTELGEGTQDTRRRASLTELIPNPQEAPLVQTVLKRLADARLITVSRESAEVAHEALIREWGTLLEWLNENREGLRLHRQLTQAAQEWDKLDREPEALYRGARLAQALEMAEAHPAELNTLEQAFLEASQAEQMAQQAAETARRQRELEAARALTDAQRQRAEAEQRRAEEQTRAASRLRRRAVYLALALSASTILLLAALWLGQLANRNAQAAQAQTRLASSRAGCRSSQQPANRSGTQCFTGPAGALHLGYPGSQELHPPGAARTAHPAHHPRSPPVPRGGLQPGWKTTGNHWHRRNGQNLGRSQRSGAARFAGKPGRVRLRDCFQPRWKTSSGPLEQPAGGVGRRKRAASADLSRQPQRRDRQPRQLQSGQHTCGGCQPGRHAASLGPGQRNPGLRAQWSRAALRCHRLQPGWIATGNRRSRRHAKDLGCRPRAGIALLRFGRCDPQPGV